MRYVYNIAARPRHPFRTTVRQKRDQSIAMMLILLILVFGFCNCFRIIINSYEVKLKSFHFISYSFWFLSDLLKPFLHYIWLYIQFVIADSKVRQNEIIDNARSFLSSPRIDVDWIWLSLMYCGVRLLSTCCMEMLSTTGQTGAPPSPTSPTPSSSSTPPSTSSSTAGKIKPSGQH